MTEAEVVERCKAFASEHGMDFAVQVELVDYGSKDGRGEPGDIADRLIIKPVADDIGASWIEGSERVCFEARHPNGDSVEYSIALSGIIEQPSAIDLWFGMIREQQRRANESK